MRRCWEVCFLGLLRTVQQPTVVAAICSLTRRRSNRGRRRFRLYSRARLVGRLWASEGKTHLLSDPRLDLWGELPIAPQASLSLRAPSHHSRGLKLPRLREQHYVRVVPVSRTGFAAVGPWNPRIAHVCFPGEHVLSRSQGALTRGEELVTPDASWSLSPLLFDQSGCDERVVMHDSILIIEQVFAYVKWLVVWIFGVGCAWRLVGIAAPVPRPTVGTGFPR